MVEAVHGLAQAVDDSFRESVSVPSRSNMIPENGLLSTIRFFVQIGRNLIGMPFGFDLRIGFKQLTVPVENISGAEDAFLYLALGLFFPPGAKIPEQPGFRIGQQRKFQPSLAAKF